MKYIIDLPEEFAEATKEYWDKTVGTQLEPYTEPDIYSHTDNSTGWELYQDYQKAKERYETWKKQMDEIHIGDEVEYENCKFVVTAEIGNKYHGIHSSNGDIVSFGEGDYCSKDNCKKTGRHFPEVVELLEKMRNELNENS